MKINQEFAPVTITLETVGEVGTLQSLLYTGKADAVKQRQSVLSSSIDHEVFVKRIEFASRILNFLEGRTA